MYKVMSGMRKRAVTVWAAVCFLLGAYGCLPLDHTCFNFAAAGLRTGVHQTSLRALSGLVFSGRATAVEAGAGSASSSRQDACLACVWVHSFLNNHSAVVSCIPDDTEAASWRFPKILAVGTEHFQAPFKRGPPSPDVV